MIEIQKIALRQNGELQRGADGVFGQATLDAVYNFQIEHQLIMDSVVGPKTWSALCSS